MGQGCSSRGKGQPQLVDGGDIDLAHETDQTSIEVKSERDVQDKIWSQDGYSDEVYSTGNGHVEVRSKDQAEEETDLDESQLNEPISERAGEPQKSRKRAGSSLSGGQKSRERR